MQEQIRKEKEVAEQRRKEAEIAAKKRAEEKAIQQKLADERKKKDQVTSQGESTQYNFQGKIQSGAIVQNNKAFKDDDFYEGGNEVDTNHIYLDLDVEQELGNYA
jgi:hypothetical protein